MPMSEEHKAALAQGRKEARAVKAYLSALESKQAGRPVTREGLESRLNAVKQKLNNEDNALTKVELLQKKLDIERAIAELEDAPDVDLMEAGFIRHAESYSERKGISYTAWRDFGVPAAILKKAGIPEIRRR